MSDNINIQNLKMKLQKISTFRYMEFPDDASSTQEVPNKSSRIFNKHYYNSVIKPIFNNYHDCIFSYLYGDFDKLNTINTTHGLPEGDRVLSKGLQIIQDTLPASAIISRLGGDEFCVIIVGAAKKTAEHYISNINKALEDNQIDLHHLTITFGAVDSLQCSGFSEMIQTAEGDVSLSKNMRDSFSDENAGRLRVHTSQALEWNILNHKIESAMKNFFTNFRFSHRQSYTKSEYENTITDFMELVRSLYKSHAEHHSHVSSFEYQNPESDNKDGLNSLLLLDSLLNSPASVHPLLSTCGQKALHSFDKVTSKVLETLTRNSGSLLLNKAYFKAFLSHEICNSGQNYQAIYFSDVGIKLSNSAYGHLLTDVRMRETSKAFIEQFSSFRKFSNSSFEFDSSDNFLLDMGSGNYVAIVNSNNSLSEEELTQLTDSMNSLSEKHNPIEESTFNMSYAQTGDVDTSSTSNLLQAILDLKAECSKNKLPIKAKIMHTDDCRQALSNSLESSFEYYFRHISESQENPEKQKMLYKNIYMSILNESLKNFKIVDDTTLDINPDHSFYEEDKDEK